MSRAVRGRNRTFHRDVIRGDAITSRTILPSLAAAQLPAAGRTSAVWRSTAGVEAPEEAGIRATLTRETVAALAAHSWNLPHQLDAVDVGPMSLPPSSAPTATGWSDSCRAGFAPAEEWRLFTAHEIVRAKRIAQAIHEKRPRGRAVFVLVNCAIFGDELFKSELFGHTRRVHGRVAGPKGAVGVVSFGGIISHDELARKVRSAGSARTAPSSSNCGSSPPPTDCWATGGGAADRTAADPHRGPHQLGTDNGAERPRPPFARSPSRQCDGDHEAGLSKLMARRRIDRLDRAATSWAPGPSAERKREVSCPLM